MTDTTDLVRRLREERCLDDAWPLMERAADMIERLSAPAPAQTWFCNKCGYFGDHPQHMRPNTETPCNYFACPTDWQKPAAPAPAQTLAEWKQQAQDFLDEPAPDAATVESIMALALAYAHEHGNWRFMGLLVELDEWPKGGSTYRREHEEARATLRAAVERVVKDAARYRWLQHEIDLGRLESDNPAVFWALAEEDGNAFDAAIDAAMNAYLKGEPK